MRLGALLGTAGLAVAVTASGASVFAQESPPQYPADIRTGTCASLGDAIVPLAPLAVPAGDPQEQGGAIPVAQSVTKVPLLLSDLLTPSHAVVVHASPEQIGTPIACGEIGGPLGDDGTLAVGLQAMNGAKMGGVASFAPTRAEDSTLVTLHLVDERSGRERAEAVVDDVDAGDSANAADGVGNVTVGPAADRAPGDDGAVDRPGPGNDGDRGGDGEAGRRAGDDGRDRGEQGRDGESGVARAGEDGTTPR